MLQQFTVLLMSLRRSRPAGGDGGGAGGDDAVDDDQWQALVKPILTQTHTHSQNGAKQSEKRGNLALLCNNKGRKIQAVCKFTRKQTLPLSLSVSLFSLLSLFYSFILTVCVCLPEQQTTAPKWQMRLKGRSLLKWVQQCSAEQWDLLMLMLLLLLVLVLVLLKTTGQSDGQTSKGPTVVAVTCLQTCCSTAVAPIRPYRISWIRTSWQFPPRLQTSRQTDRQTASCLRLLVSRAGEFVKI